MKKYEKIVLPKWYKQSQKKVKNEPYFHEFNAALLDSLRMKYSLPPEYFAQLMNISNKFVRQVFGRANREFKDGSNISLKNNLFDDQNILLTKLFIYMFNYQTNLNNLIEDYQSQGLKVVLLKPSSESEENYKLSQKYFSESEAAFFIPPSTHISMAGEAAEKTGCDVLIFDPSFGETITFENEVVYIVLPRLFFFYLDFS